MLTSEGPEDEKLPYWRALMNLSRVLLQTWFKSILALDCSTWNKIQWHDLGYFWDNADKVQNLFVKKLRGNKNSEQYIANLLWTWKQNQQGCLPHPCSTVCIESINSAKPEQLKKVLKDETRHKKSQSLKRSRVFLKKSSIFKFVVFLLYTWGRSSSF